MKELKDSVITNKQKYKFIKLFRELDNSWYHLKAFTRYSDEILIELDFFYEEYELYKAKYLDYVEELKTEDLISSGGDGDTPTHPIDGGYELLVVNKLRVDYEYIAGLLQKFVDELDENEEIDLYQYGKNIIELRKQVMEFSQYNEKLGQIVSTVVDEIEANLRKYAKSDILDVINEMKRKVIDKATSEYVNKWFIGKDLVKYEASRYKDGVLANENNFKNQADYNIYKVKTENPLSPFKFRIKMIKGFKYNLIPEIETLM